MARVIEHHEDSGHDLNANDARQAVKLGHMRYVLGISTVAIVMIYGWIWFFGI